MSLDAPDRRYGSLYCRLRHTQTLRRSRAGALRAKPKHGISGPSWCLEGSLELFWAYWCSLIAIYKVWSRVIATTDIEGNASTYTKYERHNYPARTKAKQCAVIATLSASCWMSPRRAARLHSLICIVCTVLTTVVQDSKPIPTATSRISLECDLSALHADATGYSWIG